MWKVQRPILPEEEDRVARPREDAGGDELARGVAIDADAPRVAERDQRRREEEETGRDHRSADAAEDEAVENGLVEHVGKRMPGERPAVGQHLVEPEREPDQEQAFEKRLGKLLSGGDVKGTDTARHAELNGTPDEEEEEDGERRELEAMKEVRHADII